MTLIAPTKGEKDVDRTGGAIVTPAGLHPLRALIVALGLLLAGATGTVSERADVEAWQAQRSKSLTSENGWLTLEGLFWLKEGENSFGRASANALVLDHHALPDVAGSFVLAGGHVRFVARPGSGVTLDGKAVESVELQPDTAESPTILAAGTLRFFAIERAGRLGVRVRDIDSPRRRDFRGLEYFPVDAAWAFDARFEPYEPVHHIRILNVLGMEEDSISPGALVFTKNGREWRLDAVLEEPDAQELFIMFADATSGRETYGAGRFMYVSLPQNGHVPLDFNKAYNPPCAFTDFATCPLPPRQNRLALRVEAGEKKYRAAE